MPFKMVILEKKDGIATVTLNRPEKRNAFNREMMGEMDTAFDEAARDRDVKAIILTGAGEKAFVAGADINELKACGVRASTDNSIRGQNLLNIIENSRQIVIGAIKDGYPTLAVIGALNSAAPPPTTHTPEPGPIALFFTGSLIVGVALRRKLF